MKKPETKTTETHFDEKDFHITASSKVIIPTIYKTKSNQHKIQQQVHRLSLVHPNQTNNMKKQDLDPKHGQQVGTTVSPLKPKKNQMSKLQEYNKINLSRLQINMIN